MKKRVAIWLYGGIGTGHFSQGQPLLEKLVRELCSEFEIVVYSQSLVNKDYVSKGFKLRFASLNVKNGSMRWLVLMALFLRDHFRSRYQVLCAFWGFPGGFLATLLAWMMHMPSIVNLQGGDSVGISSLNYGVMHRPMFKRLALWTYNKATILTTLTFYQKDLINRQGISRPIFVIPLGVDRSVFRAGSKKNEGLRLKF